MCCSLSALGSILHHNKIFEGTNKIERLPHLMVNKETQTSSEIFEKYMRSMELNETWDLSTKELKKLILVEQLSLIRLQKSKILSA